MHSPPIADADTAKSEAPPAGAGSLLLPVRGDPPALRFMKIVVIVLGIALVLGFFTVIGRMIYLTSGRDASIPTAPVSSPTPSTAGRDMAVAVAPGSEVRHLAIDGNQLAIHLAGTAGGPGSILLVDMATGRVTGRIALVPDERQPSGGLPGETAPGGGKGGR
ncbi:MAG: hypothetical protein JNM89_00930 [Hyphomicrobiaceae bacterium]|nr:hypothetical protein [Hyphomicrobiaceae bacterium]